MQTAKKNLNILDFPYMKINSLLLNNLFFFFFFLGDSYQGDDSQLSIHSKLEQTIWQWCIQESIAELLMASDMRTGEMRREYLSIKNLDW